VPVSEADSLSIVRGTGEYFAVIHHSATRVARLTAHSYQNFAEIVSSIELCFGEIGSTNASDLERLEFSGQTSAWRFLPRTYVVQTRDEHLLVLVDPTKMTARIQPLTWYDKSYDKMYQAILDVTEIPGTTLLIISVQRDSEPVLYDSAAKRVLKKLKLAGRHGNPQLWLRHSASELWASDYDTMVRLDSRDWRVLDTLKLQESQGGMAMVNVGKYYFPRDENLCLVARPHSGDVIGIDPNKFAAIFRSETGGQPEDVGLLRDNSVIARDLKTGRLLQGTLHRV
jgi:hypothetical protein